MFLLALIICTKPLLSAAESCTTVLPSPTSSLSDLTGTAARDKSPKRVAAPIGSDNSPIVTTSPTLSRRRFPLGQNELSPDAAAPLESIASAEQDMADKVSVPSSCTRMALAVAAALVLCGCVTQPIGPSIAIMPAANKPFAVFQDDQVLCKQYASQQVSGEADEANNRAVGTAVIGTVLGAGLGAAFGGGGGAAIGAGTGAVFGTAAASGPADRSQYGLQRRYDISYAQCMYARGNQLPGYYSAPAPPPPPPGYPPPPPR